MTEQLSQLFIYSAKLCLPQRVTFLLYICLILWQSLPSHLCKQKNQQTVLSAPFFTAPKYCSFTQSEREKSSSFPLTHYSLQYAWPTLPLSQRRNNLSVICFIRDLRLVILSSDMCCDGGVKFRPCIKNDDGLTTKRGFEFVVEYMVFSKSCYPSFKIVSALSYYLSEWPHHSVWASFIHYSQVFTEITTRLTGKLFFP